MGSSKDVIYSYAERSLKKVYPLDEGWTFQRNFGKDGISPDYVFSRKWRGLSEYALATVIMSSQIQEQDLEVFYASLPEIKKGASRKTLIVPQGADLSVVPEDIDVLELSGFAIANGMVVWEKKKVALAEKST